MICWPPEARQASFVAIAGYPAEALVPAGQGIDYGGGFEGAPFLEWHMFEYMMPLLIMRNYEYTLPDETYTAVVAAQMQYGEQRRVPWGIESGFMHSICI